MTKRFALSGLLLSLGAGFIVDGCSNNQAAGGFTPPPMPVEAVKVEAGTVTDRFEAVGTIEAHDAITVVSEIDALVRDLPFREGAPIQKGELIAQLDDSQLQAELSRAEAVRDQKKVTYDRIKSLADSGAVAAQEFDNAAAAFKVAEAELAMIQARLQKTRITAPFNGVIGARRVSPGAFVRAGTAITDLARLDELKVTFTAPERYYPELKRGASVTVSTTAYPDFELNGTIEVIEPVVDEATRSARIIAHVRNPELKFRPGMSANVAAVLSKRDNAVLIPDEAVFAEGNQNLVFVIKPDSTVTRTAITLGSRQPETVEVLSGLEPGMTVVRAGHQKLFEGAKVMPMPAVTSAPMSDLAGGSR
ncbi:MAG: efflux RND transporter periplasmic adaptor subunit [Candidatus Zixiibacteriota bacterium]